MGPQHRPNTNSLGQGQDYYPNQDPHLEQQLVRPLKLIIIMHIIMTYGFFF